MEDIEHKILELSKENENIRQACQMVIEFLRLKNMECSLLMEGEITTRCKIPDSPVGILGAYYTEFMRFLFKKETESRIHQQQLDVSMRLYKALSLLISDSG